MTPEPAHCRCTIVVPWYNEARRFATAPWLQFLALDDPASRAISFLFVNDGSTDNTLALLENLRLGHEDRIAILDKKINGGKAEAIRDGMVLALRASQAAAAPASGAGNAACSCIGFWDADLATPLAAIPRLLHILEAVPHLGMIFGSRVRLLGRTIHRNPARHYLGRLFATVASLMLELPIYDTQCGAKIFKVTPDLAPVLAAPFISRWIFDVEIIARFLQLRGRAFCFNSIYEFPLESWEDVAGSKVGPFDFLYAALDIVRIYLRYLAPGRLP